MTKSKNGVGMRQSLPCWSSFSYRVPLPLHKNFSFGLKSQNVYDARLHRAPFRPRCFLLLFWYFPFCFDIFPFVLFSWRCCALEITLAPHVRHFARRFSPPGTDKRTDTPKENVLPDRLLSSFFWVGQFQNMKRIFFWGDETKVPKSSSSSFSTSEMDF